MPKPGCVAVLSRKWCTTSATLVLPASSRSRAYSPNSSGHTSPRNLALTLRASCSSLHTSSCTTRSTKRTTSGGSLVIPRHSACHASVPISSTTILRAVEYVCVSIASRNARYCVRTSMSRILTACAPARRRIDAMRACASLVQWKRSHTICAYLPRAYMAIAVHSRSASSSRIMSTLALSRFVGCDARDTLSWICAIHGEAGSSSVVRSASPCT